MLGQFFMRPFDAYGSVNLDPFYQDIYVYYIASSNIKYMGNKYYIKL